MRLSDQRAGKTIETPNFWGEFMSTPRPFRDAPHMIRITHQKRERIAKILTPKTRSAQCETLPVNAVEQSFPRKQRFSVHHTSSGGRGSRSAVESLHGPTSRLSGSFALPDAGLPTKNVTPRCVPGRRCVPDRRFCFPGDHDIRSTQFLCRNAQKMLSESVTRFI